MGKSSGQQQVNNDPWKPAQGSLQFGLNEANRIYGAMNPGSQVPGSPNMMGPWTMTGGAPYGGGQFPERIAMQLGIPQGGWQMQQQAQQTGTSQAPFDPNSVSGYNLWAPAEAEMMKTISGGYLNGDNPYLESLIGRARQGVNSNFSGMSRYGSGAHMDQLFTQAEAPLRYQDYSAERGRQQTAIGALPQFTQGMANAPYADLNAYMGVVNPVARQGGSTNQPTQNNPLAGAAGGALMGAGLAPAGASLMGSAATAGAAAVPAMWPWLLGGALLGGFAS